MKNIKLTNNLFRIKILLLILFFTSSYLYSEKKDAPNDKIIKIYPNTKGNFWSILKGSHIEFLNKKTENSYRFLSFNSTFNNTEGNTETAYKQTNSLLKDKFKNHANAYLLGVGYGHIDYTPYKLWNYFKKHKVNLSFEKITSNNNGLNESNSTTEYFIDSNKDTFTLSYCYYLGIEKKLLQHVSLGVEAALLYAHIQYSSLTENRKNSQSNLTRNDDATSNTWNFYANSFNSFCIYIRLNFINL